MNPLWAGGDTLFDFYSLATTMWGLAVPLAFLGAFVCGPRELFSRAFRRLRQLDDSTTRRPDDSSPEKAPDTGGGFVRQTAALSRTHP